MFLFGLFPSAASRTPQRATPDRVAPPVAAPRADQTAATDKPGSEAATGERITMQTIAFDSPFRVEGLAGEQPAGRYEVEMVEEPLEGLSFLAWRLVDASIVMPVPGGGRNSMQMLKIEPALVRAALAGAESPASPALA